LNTDPYPVPVPIRIQGFNEQKFENFAAEKTLYIFFGLKIAVYLSSIMDVQATEKAFSPQKRTSRLMI
jgi:hypothetical protein